MSNLFETLSPFLRRATSFVSIFLAVAGISLSSWQIWQTKQLQQQYSNFAKQTPETSPTQASSVKDSVVVSVVGAVNQPAVLSLPTDSRVGDALQAAGGVATQDAQLDFYQTLNLAEKLKDGQQIMVPFQQADAVSNALTTSVSNGKISLNTASSAELDALPGMGAVRVQKLIEGRPFASWEELKAKLSLPESVVNNLQESAQL